MRVAGVMFCAWSHRVPVYSAHRTPIVLPRKHATLSRLLMPTNYDLSERPVVRRFSVEEEAHRPKGALMTQSLDTPQEAPGLVSKGDEILFKLMSDWTTDLIQHVLPWLKPSRPWKAPPKQPFSAGDSARLKLKFNPKVPRSGTRSLLVGEARDVVVPHCPEESQELSWPLLDQHIEALSEMRVQIESWSGFESILIGHDIEVPAGDEGDTRGNRPRAEESLVSRRLLTG